MSTFASERQVSPWVLSQWNFLAETHQTTWNFRPGKMKVCTWAQKLNGQGWAQERGLGSCCHFSSSSAEPEPVHIPLSRARWHMFRDFLSCLLNTGISDVLSFPGLADAGSTSEGTACEARELASSATSFLGDPGRPCPLPCAQFLHL